ncbi:MAG: hypothetical protein IPH10_11425 [bacterium]|nr:hypothetical protein [bacterium]
MLQLQSSRPISLRVVTLLALLVVATGPAIAGTVWQQMKVNPHDDEKVAVTPLANSEPDASFPPATGICSDQRPVQPTTSAPVSPRRPVAASTILTDSTLARPAHSAAPSAE